MVNSTSIQNEANAHPDHPICGDRGSSAPGDLHNDVCAETMQHGSSAEETVEETASVKMSPVKPVRSTCPSRHDCNGV